VQAVEEVCVEQSDAARTRSGDDADARGRVHEGCLPAIIRRPIGGQVHHQREEQGPPGVAVGVRPVRARPWRLRVKMSSTAAGAAGGGAGAAPPKAGGGANAGGGTGSAGAAAAAVASSTDTYRGRSALCAPAGHSAPASAACAAAALAGDPYTQ